MNLPGTFRRTVLTLSLGCAPVCAGIMCAPSAVLAQTAVITLPAVLLAEPAVETALDIRIGPAGAIPPQSFVRLRGLPISAKLSEGHVITPGAWAVPLSALPGLKMLAPVSSSGRTDLIVTLLTLEGAVIAESKAALVVAPAWLLAQGEARAKETGTTAAQATASLAPAAPVPAPIPAMPAANAAPDAPPPPALPALAPADVARAEQYIYQGDTYRAQGNIAAARQFYRRSADMGHATAAMRLAATFDAAELALLQVQGIQPNPAEARKWYERARELGAADATTRLARMGTR